MSQANRLNEMELVTIKRFVKCEITLDELSAHLSGKISNSANSGELNLRISADANISIPFESEDIKSVLRKFIQGRVDDACIVVWAKTLRVWPTLVIRREHEEVIKEVIYLLGSPETHTAITLKNISYLLNCIDENIMPDEGVLEGDI